MIFGIKRIDRTFLAVLFFLFLSLLLILAWFKNGHFYGGGDVGLPTYNPQRLFELSKYIWWEAVAPGFLIPHVITSVTLYFFLSFFQFFGIGPVGIQEILFFVLLFLMGFGMYLLTLSILGNDKKIHAVIAGLFYIFNPYMMTQIWHRFIHTSFFFVASIPFLILFWRLWIKSGNYFYLLYFLLVNLLTSYMFGTIAFVVPFWLIMSLFTISEIFFPWESKSHLNKVLWRFIFGLGVWILFNSWWLIPVATISQGVASQQHDIGESLSTLVAISKQAVIPFSLQMVNSYYIFAQAELGEIYKSFFFRLIPWLGVAIIFLGIVYALRRKHLAAIVLIYLIIIVLSKGVSSPFGQPYLLLFSKFFALGLLRNPFEKLGILLPVVGSILFAAGIEGFFSWFGKYLGNLGMKFILVILLALMGVYYWPMYQGKIFGRIDQPNYVEIPQSYTEADKWLNQRVREDSKIDGKILHLPLTRSDIATYKWQYGYHGIESSASLFTSLPSISHGVSLKGIDDSLEALSLIFHKPYSLHQDKILKLLQDFNVRFIVLHKDIQWRGVDIYDPQETEKVLDSLTFLVRKTQFGELIIYEILPEYFKPKVVLTDVINFAYPEKATMRMWPWLAHQNEGDILTPFNDNDTDKILNSSNEIMIFPTKSFNYLEASEKGLDSIANNLVNILYQLANIVQDDDKDGEELITKLISSGEDLINAILYVKNGNSQLAISLIKKYSEETSDFLDNDTRNSKLKFLVAETTLNDFFKSQLLLLENLKINELEATRDKIKQDLNKQGLLPMYPYESRESFTVLDRLIKQFKIPKPGKYEILLTNSQINKIYPKELASLDFQINGKLTNLKGTTKDDLISFGELNFNQGIYEISFDKVLSMNLVPSLDKIYKSDNVKIDKDTIQLSSDGQKASLIESDLGPISGEDTYQIMFDGSFLQGVEFYVQIIQDGDIIESGKPRPRIGTVIDRTKNDNSFQSFRFQLPPLNIATRQAKIRIIVDPIGATFFNNPNSYATPTSINIKNLQVFRVLDNEIFLRSNNKQDVPISNAGDITEFEHNSPVLYQGKIKINNPSYVIFKEAYHPGWELELRKDNKVIKPDQHYIANLYSNAWWVEQPGEYNFKIEFKPQQKVTLGIYLALTGLLGVITLMLVTKIKQIYGRR